MPDVNESFRQELAQKERELSALQKRRDTMRADVTKTKKYRDWKARKDKLEHEEEILRNRMNMIEDKVWARFLLDDRKYPYYDPSRSLSKTNINQTVLSAISTVSPLSKLMGSLIEDTVRRMVELALHNHKTYAIYKKRLDAKHAESYDIWDRLMELERGGATRELDERLSALRQEVRQMREIVNNPVKYERRHDIIIARDKVRTGIREIYSKFEEIERHD